MAKKSLVVKQQRLAKKFFEAKEWWKAMKHPTKYYNRCKLCWRVRSYMREYWACRCCFRKYARLWQIMWVKKSSR